MSPTEQALLVEALEVLSITGTIVQQTKINYLKTY